MNVSLWSSAALPWISLRPLFDRLVTPSEDPSTDAAASKKLVTRTGPDLFDPDGYDGFTTKGNYDRLLVSEWLLADEAPDEFDRRAANGEHTFYRLRLPQPTATRRCRILFETGPAQLGAPRVVHFAVLLLLVTRAADANAELRWTVAGPATPTPWWTEVNGTTVNAWKKARSWFGPDAATLEAQLAAEPVDRSEVWLVGSAALGAIGARLGYSRVVVEEQAEPDLVRVTVTRPGGKATRSVELELPAPEACAELLRETASMSVKRGAVVKPSRCAKVTFPLDLSVAPIFTPTGSRVVAKQQNGGFVACPLTLTRNGPARPPHKTFWIPPNGEQLIAVGYQKGKAVAVTADDHLAFYLVDSATRYRLMHRRSPISGKKSTHWRSLLDCGSLLTTRAPHNLLSGKNHLFALRSKQDDLYQPLGPLLASSGLREGPEVVLALTCATAGQNLRLHLVRDTDAPEDKAKEQNPFWESESPMLSLRDALAFVGRASLIEGQIHVLAGFWPNQNAKWDVVYLRYRAESARWSLLRHWQLSTSMGSAGGNDGPFAEVGLSASWHVGGKPPLEGGEPYLIVLASEKGSRRSLRMVGQDGHRPICTAPTPIVHVVCSPYDPFLAFVTEDGALYACPFAGGEPTLLHPGTR